MQTNEKAKASGQGPFTYKISEMTAKNSEGKEISFTEIAIAGKLEFLTGFEQEKNFIDVLEMKSDRLVLNLKDVSFINSLGLNFLLNEFDKCSKKNIRLYMAGTGSYVMKVFTITRLDGIFKLINESAECANDN
jgi:anti-anti-sigma factor